ncbi:MAG TPA: class I SAM-dependent methyltransferase [Candidatus Binatia bacterium]|nr:class I SAM-dependent methyltransferase [Candidatus Binatia bacterium]
MSYDATARGYNELHGAEQDRKARIILDYLKKHGLIDDYTRVLDVGCGTCRATGLFPGDKTGIDPSKELLKQCRAPVKLVHGSAESLPFPDGWFDLVISLTAVHNFTHIEQGLKEMRRVGNKVWVITLLKKSPKFASMEALLRKLFKVETVLEDETDAIFILR